VLEQLALPRRDEGADRASVAAGREPTRVAVRERARAGCDQVGGVRGHRPAPRDLVPMDRARVLGRRVAAHLVERPREIDGGRPRGAQYAVGLVDVLSVRGRMRDPVRGCDADRRRAADHHRADRVGELDRRATGHLDLLVRQPALIEQHDTVVLEPQDPFGIERHGVATARAARTPSSCARGTRTTS
jgi:hypothetical protein